LNIRIFGNKTFLPKPVTSRFFFSHIKKGKKKELQKVSKDIHGELIERCCKNDGVAQLRIYEYYFKQMYNTSLRILNDPEEAEDVMQESFLDAFRKIHSYSGDGSFGGWLRRIVVNNSLDALRKRKNELSLDEERIEIPDIEDKYDENINYRVDEIKNAIKNLSDDDRIIISLFLFEGYDHDEISQILSISNNTSRTRYSRAKKRLLRRLTVSRAESIFNLN